ncbi:MAG: UvrD-helicase domain-containing protein, partial [Anaeroplasmataceae bacterium]|nr:UvrD-helicase domain-containing protein [Anaeroplasmataceae bacterium]
MVKNNKDLLEKYQDKFIYILVDEFQDTNDLQYQLIWMLANRYQNIFVVGDDFQSI